MKVKLSTLTLTCINLALLVHYLHAVYFYSNKALPSQIMYLHTVSFPVFCEHELEYVTNKFFLLSVLQL